MLDRFLKLIVTLAVLLFLLQSAIGVLGRVLEAVVAGGASTLTHGGPVMAVVALCFIAGLLIRLFQFVTTRDPRKARDRASRERAIRQRARRPAEGVQPLDDRRHERPDPDPAIGEEDRP